MKSFLQRVRPILLPRNSQREKLARFLLRTFPGLRALISGGYKTWIRENEPAAEDLKKQSTSIVFSSQPLISIVVPVFSPPAPILRAMVDSVISQTYPNWQLLIANGNPGDQATAAILLEYKNKDSRILLHSVPKNLGISGNTNAAINGAQGEFVAFLDHDDCLAPFAIYEVVRAINASPTTDLLYSDEDYLTPDGKRRYNPVFKPSFGIDTLRSSNYMPHLLVIRKSLGDTLGWLRSDFDGAQDYDLILRAVEKARMITHIPQILYHWRAIPGSTASSIDSKQYASQAGAKALSEHLMRCNLPASVHPGPFPTTYHIRYQYQRNPLISIIIPNQDHAAELKICVDSILTKSSYSNYEVLIVENNSQFEETQLLYRDLNNRDQRVKLMEFHQQPFNYSDINNAAAKSAKGEIFVFLNNDTQVLTTGWLEAMLEFCIRPDVGAVGAKLYYPNWTIQHAGLVIGMGVGAGHYFNAYPKAHPGYRYNLQLPQNLSAVTAACLMTRREVFNHVGGFDPAYRLGFGDIDLCLKIRAHGYQIVWTPFAELIHYESLTRGYEDTPEKEHRFYREANLLMQKWDFLYKQGDPAYNPNLSLTRGDFSVRPGKCDHTPRTTKGLSDQGTDWFSQLS